MSFKINKFYNNNFFVVEKFNYAHFSNSDTRKAVSTLPAGQVEVWKTAD